MCSQTSCKTVPTMESVPTLLSLTVKMRRGKDRKSVDALHGNNGTCPALHTGLPFIVNVLLSPLGGYVGSQLLYN